MIIREILETDIYLLKISVKYSMVFYDLTGLQLSGRSGKEASKTLGYVQ